MMRHQVVIAGGGPTGMMLAAELKLAGIDVAIVERRTTPELMRSGALGLHARTIEVLDQRGIADRFVSASVEKHVRAWENEARHQRLSLAASLRAGADAEAHRTHPRGLGR